MNTGIATLDRDIEKMRDNFQHTFKNLLGAKKTAGVGEYTTEWVPDADVAENDEAFTLRVALPGVKKETVETAVKDNTLIVTGRRDTEDASRKDLIRQEIPQGRFYRAFKIGVQIRSGDVKASLRDGILEIKLPKSAEARPSRIMVE